MIEKLDINTVRLYRPNDDVLYKINELVDAHNNQYGEGIKRCGANKPAEQTGHYPPCLKCADRLVSEKYQEALQKIVNTYTGDCHCADIAKTSLEGGE